MQASSEPAIARPGMAPVVLVLALSVLFPVRDAAAAQPRDHEQAFQTHPFFVAYSTGLFDPRGAPAGTSAKAAGATVVAAGSCGRDLREFWKPGEFLVNGASHWLVRVFTIDLDGDGQVDNLGFRLRPREGPDLLLRHFEPPGTRGLAALPGLEPPAGVKVSEFCFGRVEFPVPEEIPEDTAKALGMPDLAAEARARMEGGEKAGEVGGREDKAVSKVSGTGFWAGIAGGTPVLLAVGFAGLYMNRRRKSKGLPLLGMRPNPVPTRPPAAGRRRDSSLDGGRSFGHHA